MTKLILQIIAGVAGLWLATQFVSGVIFIGTMQQLLLAGAVLGLINFFLKPIVKFITLPIRILTLGLFTFVINMVMVWLLQAFFPELIISGLLPLFWTTLIISIATFLLGFYAPKRKAETQPKN